MDNILFQQILNILMSVTTIILSIRLLKSTRRMEEVEKYLINQIELENSERRKKREKELEEITRLVHERKNKLEDVHEGDVMVHNK